jgi:hypothetical protein
MLEFGQFPILQLSSVTQSQDGCSRRQGCLRWAKHQIGTGPRSDEPDPQTRARALIVVLDLGKISSDAPSLIMGKCALLLCLMSSFLAVPQAGMAAQALTRRSALAVMRPLDDSGQRLERAALTRLRTAVADGLRAQGIEVVVTSPFSRAVAEAQVRPRLIQCPVFPNSAPLPFLSGEEDCLGTVALVDRVSGRVRFEAVARSGSSGGLGELGSAMARAVAHALRPQSIQARSPGEEISAGGVVVRHLTDGRFDVAGTNIDVHAITYSHNPAIDPDVPGATDVTLGDTVPALADSAGRPYAVITLYQVDPPLTGQPSREAGIDRGTDFRDPANLVKAAYTNYVSPVLTDDPVPVRVAGHPIGHFFVKVEVPGYPTLLTGMTTVARADTELVDKTVRRQLGIGGVLLTPQPGRLNSAAEVVRELALRQRRLRVVDGLYFHNVRGRNVGPEYVFEDGRVVFARIKLPVRNATDALAYFAEFVQRGQQNRFGSLLNRPFKGTGAGCAAFAMSLLQAAGAIPFITEPAPGSVPAESETLGPTEFWRAVHANVHIPWRDLGCDERVGAARAFPAELTIYDLLFHGETAAFVRRASEGVAAQIRNSYGAVPATLFQFGVLTPLRDLVINSHRKDPNDRADYTWSGAGIDVPYWDNSRFAAWVRRVWDKGPRDPRLTLAREGRFIGVEIDATAAPRQREPFFAAADRIKAARVSAPRAESCQEVFDRGLE